MICIAFQQIMIFQTNLTILIYMMEQTTHKNGMKKYTEMKNMWTPFLFPQSECRPIYLNRLNSGYQSHSRLVFCIQVSCSNLSWDTSHPEVSLYFPQSLHTNAWAIPSSGHNPVFTNSLSSSLPTIHPTNNTTICDTKCVIKQHTARLLNSLQFESTLTTTIFYENQMSTC